MADLYSRSFQDPAVPVRNMPQWRLRDIPFAFVTAATNAIGDKLFVAIVHPEARISYASQIKHAGIAGGTDVDFGDESNPDGLIDGINLATAALAGKSLFPGLHLGGTAEDPVWKLLGYTASPQKPIELFFTLKTDVTGAGAIEGNLLISEPA